MTIAQPTEPAPPVSPRIAVNVPIPADLHRRLKIAAASERLTVREAVISAIDAWCSSKR